jgi:hypothetical protein
MLSAGVLANSAEWSVSAKPYKLGNGDMVCGLYSPNPDRSVGFSVYYQSSDLVITTSSLVGVATSASAVLRFPSGQQQRVTLRKDSAESDTAVLEIATQSELDAMIADFTAPGDFSVAVPGG